MNSFKKYHPIINLIYFLIIIIMSVFVLHPVYTVISFALSVTYAVILKGKKAVFFNMVYMLPLIIFSSFINMMFNHQGVTTLFYLKTNNPVTLESILYGINASFMFVAVINWFSCFNEVIESDKFIYLFGRLAPVLSLILSMILRFIPKFLRHQKEVLNAQTGIGKGINEGNIFTRIKNLLKVFSINLTWALENSIEVSDSMKSRGYGLKKRTSYSNYVFNSFDKNALIYIITLTVLIIISFFKGGLSYRFYPSIKGDYLSFKTILGAFAYFMFCMLPVFIQIKECLYWNHIKSKI